MDVQLQAAKQKYSLKKNTTNKNNNKIMIIIISRVDENKIVLEYWSSPSVVERRKYNVRMSNHRIVVYIPFSSSYILRLVFRFLSCVGR